MSSRVAARAAVALRVMLRVGVLGVRLVLMLVWGVLRVEMAAREMLGVLDVCSRVITRFLFVATRDWMFVDALRADTFLSSVFFVVVVPRVVSDCIAFVRCVFLSRSRTVIAAFFVVRDVTADVVDFCMSVFCL